MLQLRALTSADEEPALAAHGELAREDFAFLLGLEAGETWPEYLDRLERLRQGIDVPDGLVPATFLVAEADGEIVGRSSIRHTLDAWLAELGGHIGYAVRPAFRRRGNATEILLGSLRVAASVGVERALLTCDETNTASIRVIERCGGVFERHTTVDDGLPVRRRYWITVPEVAGG